MTDLNRMLAVIEELRAKHPEPAVNWMRMHPDDIEALKREAEPLLTHKIPGLDRGLSITGVKLIPDESAPRLPRKKQ